MIKSYEFTRSVMVLLLLAVIACSSSGNRDDSVILLPKSGSVHEHLSCASNSLFTYALFLPSSCPRQFSVSDKDKRFPVIICFDPSGQGNIPVKRFSELAEKYGIILVGSNDSKNGQSPEESVNAVEILFREVEFRLPFDSSAIYVMGFSGGSRVATATAMYKPYVKGVIACGAGFPSGVPLPGYRFDYFGIVGLGDFNLGEMVSLDKALEEIDFRHFICKFNGIHSWPGSAEVEKAWLWHKLNSMKDGKDSKNDSLIRMFSKNYAGEYDHLRNTGLFLSQYQNLSYRISALEGLADVTTLKSLREALKASKEYQTEVKKFEDVLSRELNEQNVLNDALTGKDLRWWNDRLAKYRDNKNPKLSAEDTLMNHRILAYLGLLCYSRSTAFLKQNKPEDARKVLAIYMLVEPDNTEPLYAMAVLQARQHDTIQTFNYLRAAYDKGFRDKSRMTRQKEFEFIRNHSIYLDLISKMK